VQVRQPGGKVLYDHVMKPGESWSVPPDAGEVTLSTGNAGGLTVFADGVTSPVLGRVGAVRRGVPLTVAAIKDGSIAMTGAASTTGVRAPDRTPSVVRRPGAHSPTTTEPDNATDQLNQSQLNPAQH
jgi:cytoskeleton protein RodZ